MAGIDQTKRRRGAEVRVAASLNLLMPKNDQHLFSPNNITPELYIKVLRIKEMITNWISSWYLNKFFLSVPNEVFGEQNGEYAHQC